jgi:uncharacterized protein YbjT (DUF2867 family)
MILVAGATGVLGSEIVRRLIDRGQKVRALVRPTSAPEKVEALEKFGAEIARGDLKDRASLEAACKGVERVVSTVTVIATAKPGDDFQTVDRDGTISLIDAAADAGVKQFVFVSFKTEGMPEAPLVAAKRAVEEHLRQSGITHTILQPSLFMEIWLSPMLFADPGAGTARIYGSGDHGISYVSVGDVAEVSVRVLTEPIAGNATITFGGPQPVSQNQAVEIFSIAFGKQFDVTQIPEEALEAQWQSAPDPFQKTFSALMLSVAQGFGAAAPPDQERFPVQLTTVEQFVARSADG